MKRTTARSWLMKMYDRPSSSCRSLQQVEHLGLDRHVERAHRLSSTSTLGIQRQAARDGDALALAARELVRIPAHGRLVQADLAQQRAGARLALGSCRRRRRGSPFGSTSVWPIVEARV
jgi:hypothetical protein